MPITRAGRNHLGTPFSNADTSSKAGPSVIYKNKSEGGYLFVLRNDTAVHNGHFCGDPGNGSPYTFKYLSATKPAISAIPAKSIADLHCGAFPQFSGMRNVTLAP